MAPLAAAQSTMGGLNSLRASARHVHLGRLYRNVSYAPKSVVNGAQALSLENFVIVDNEWKRIQRVSPQSTTHCNANTAQQSTAGEGLDWGFPSAAMIQF